jgi:hypothetical protein
MWLFLATASNVVSDSKEDLKVNASIKGEI